MPEQRVHPRITCCEPVEVSGQGFVPFTALVTDLSLGGARIQTRQPLPKGRELSIRLSGASMALTIESGIVVWRKPFEPINVDGVLPGMGVAFKRVSEESQGQIRGLLDSRTGKESAERKAVAARPVAILQAPPIPPAPVPRAPSHGPRPGDPTLVPGRRPRGSSLSIMLMACAGVLALGATIIEVVNGQDMRRIEASHREMVARVAVLEAQSEIARLSSIRAESVRSPQAV